MEKRFTPNGTVLPAEARIPKDAAFPAEERPTKDEWAARLPARQLHPAESERLPRPAPEEAPKAVPTPQRTEDDAPDPVIPGDAILAGMLHKPGSMEAIASFPAAHAGMEIQVVERILASVSEAGKNGEMSEVRITLKDAVLQDTEIRIQCDGEQLAVLFVTGNERSELALAPRLRDLQTLLTQRFSGEVRVSLESPDMGGNAQGDGRSRQQRNIFEEMDSERVRRADR